MNKLQPGKQAIRINFPSAKDKYFVLTDKTGCPSAEFRGKPGGGLVVPDARESSADP